ncbi:hypothetical protein BC936DRAFT_146214 [Jimgerdemannia flammicorona]|uniref:P-loop containing nucleoside triphosphate hydrolase protein n=1 Tax=Jimgerdemannia flammicorona TaxID=994334 RepID=A0A433D871_9FUNG|nr:hypothetical protein BC936DRAFT_146214 [Jimgerdemannia flammicorona]
MFNTRRSDTSSNAHREIINQFMVEWDGLRSNNKGVLLMAATNRPFDLDDAILRRMPRLDLPNEADRHHILSIHLRGEQLDPSISISELAKNTAYFSGSDLKNLCVSAALAAVHEASLGLLLSSAGGAEASASSSQTSSSPASSSPASSSPASSPADTVSQHDKIPVRVLRPHHFEKALSQVTPSCSEDMYSLIEIRKWDAIYGDGAKQRNKKPVIGFGTGEVGSVASSVNNVKLAE